MSGIGYSVSFQSVCWNVAFVLGTFFFIYGIIYIFRTKGIKEEHFIKAGAFEFLASWIMYIPEAFFNDTPDSLPFLKAVESIITALLTTFNIYLGNGYERVAFLGRPIFSSIYAILMTSANIVLLLFVAGFIIRFLNGPLQRIKLSFNRKRYTYIFSACNEKTMAIARSVPQKKKKLIFSFGNNVVESIEKQQMDAIDGIYVDLTVSEILNKTIKKNSKMEIFLFGNSEEDNLSQLEIICDYLKDKSFEAVRVFIELLNTPWSLYDDFLEKHNSSDDNRFVINFVRTEENFAYNNFLKHSIFEIQLVSGDEKIIKFLIAGMNDRNLEVLKTILHLGQMPGFRLELMVLDEKAGRQSLRMKMPEVHDECDTKGDAVYKLIYKENVDFHSGDHLQIIEKEFMDFSFAFVNAGDDLLNASIGMNINMLCSRHNRSDQYRIQVNIVNEDLYKDWDMNLTEKLDFVGATNKVYDYGFITMSDIERGTIAIHKVRYPEGTDRYKSWISYCNNEYNRHSVYARTLSFKYKVNIIHDKYDPQNKLKGTDKEWDIYSVTGIDNSEWKVYEHMRWNMYTRTMGYILADKSQLDGKNELNPRKRAVAKIHNDLVLFDKLPPDEQKKDALKLTPEIVQILESL